MKKQIYFYIIGGLFILMVFGVKQCQLNKERDKYQIAQVELAAFNDSVKVYKSKTGELTAKVASVTVEADNRKKALDAAGFEIKDLRKRDINQSNVILALNAKIVALGKGTIILKDSITPGDSIPIKTGKWNDKFLYLEPMVKGNKLDFKYKYETGIKILDEKKGKSYIISAYLVDPNNPDIENPYATITTANSITIVPKKKWWGWRLIEDAAAVALGYMIAK